MSYQFHVAVVETQNGDVRLPVRSSSQDAFKDGISFCNGSRPFRIVPLLGRDAMPLIIQDRKASHVLRH